jgi:hypothetical protein
VWRRRQGFKNRGSRGGDGEATAGLKFMKSQSTCLTASSRSEPRCPSRDWAGGG